MAWLHIVTTLCIGLMIGVEFAVSAFINPILWQLDRPAQVIRFFAARLGAAMPFWYVLGLLLLIAETILHRHQPGLLLLAIASGIWAAIILATILFLVPINNRLARPTSSASPEQILQAHHQWDTLHRLRIIALTAAMLFFLIAVFP
ncbi:MAG: DUF1772 domain-containing protein [Silvibacterium sp.]